MLRPLATVARPLIVTTRAGTARGRRGESRRRRPVDGIDRSDRVPSTSREALDAGWERAPRIAAAGSLYLAGDVLDAAPVRARSLHRRGADDRVGRPRDA